MVFWEAAKQGGFLSFTYPVLATNNIEVPISLAHSHLSVQRRSSIQLHSSQRPLAKLLFAWFEQLKFDMSSKQTEKVF